MVPYVSYRGIIRTALNTSAGSEDSNHEARLLVFVSAHKLFTEIPMLMIHSSSIVPSLGLRFLVWSSSRALI
jgi:hypothetical protein